MIYLLFCDLFVIYLCLFDLFVVCVVNLKGPDIASPKNRVNFWPVFLKTESVFGLFFILTFKVKKMALSTKHQLHSNK
jgi:hypothetical protein